MLYPSAVLNSLLMLDPGGEGRGEEGRRTMALLHEHCYSTIAQNFRGHVISYKSEQGVKGLLVKFHMRGSLYYMKTSTVNTRVQSLWNEQKLVCK